MSETRNNFRLPDFELALSVIPPETWRNNAGVTLSDDKTWRKTRETVLRRDDYTCLACGFRSRSFMEVHHKNGYWWDDDVSNLGTFCPLCHSCFHIGLAGLNKRGRLLRLDHLRLNDSPFLRQNYLNRAILENVRAYKDKKVIDIIRHKIKGFIKEDLGSSGLVELADYMLSIIKDTPDLKKIPQAEYNYIFFPGKRFPIMNGIIQARDGLIP